MALLSLLLLLSLSSSPSLLTPAAAVCAPRSSPYQVVLDNYLPAPAVGDDATDYDDDDDSPSPSPTPSSLSPVKSPAPAPKMSATSPSPALAPKALAPAASTPKPSATTSPSPAPAASTSKPSVTTSPSSAPKASAPAAPTQKPSVATSPSPALKASTPTTAKPSAATSPSPAPKASAPTTATPKPSAATSASPSGSGDKHGSGSMDTPQAKAVGAVADVAAGVSSILGGVSGVLDPSLKPICAMVPFPAICEGNVKAAAPKSLKSVDVRSAFHLMMEAYTDEIRDMRDKSRALATSDLYSDPLNSCNRSLGGMLRTSKEMVTSFENDDGGTLKSGMDSLVSSLMSCKEKATVIQKDMERLYNIWENIEAIFEKLYPALDPHKMFPH